MGARDAMEYSPAGAGAMLRLIRAGEALTRADLVRLTGLARSTVAQRVDALVARGFVAETRGTVSTGGRPPTTLAFNDRAGVVLVADLGATHGRVAVSDLAGVPLAEREDRLYVAAGPESVLGWVDERFAELLAGLEQDPASVRGVGIGVAGAGGGGRGRVASSTGRRVTPPIMPGWNGFSIPQWFAGRYAAPVLVDND